MDSSLRRKTVFSTDPEFRDLAETPKPVRCPYCGKELRTKGFYCAEKVVWMRGHPEHCDCDQAVESYKKCEEARKESEEAARKAAEENRMKARIARIVGESGMGARFRSRTFETFCVTDRNRTAAETAKRYADGFDAMMTHGSASAPGKNGLMISGPPGTGKTHLAAAIANELIHKGRPVICMTMIDMLDRIKRTYRDYGTDEADVLRMYKTVPLLIVDDIGKERPTEWAISTIYSIINGRYEAYMPIIVTTNYNTDALIRRMTPRETGDDTTAKATIDRLVEMCRGVSMTGESWRRR